MDKLLISTIAILIGAAALSATKDANKKTICQPDHYRWCGTTLGCCECRPLARMTYVEGRGWAAEFLRQRRD